MSFQTVPAGCWCVLFFKSRKKPEPLHVFFEIASKMPKRKQPKKSIDLEKKLCDLSKDTFNQIAGKIERAENKNWKEESGAAGIGGLTVEQAVTCIMLDAACDEAVADPLEGAPPAKKGTGDYVRMMVRDKLIDVEELLCYSDSEDQDAVEVVGTVPAVPMKQKALAGKRCLCLLLTL